MVFESETIADWNQPTLLSVLLELSQCINLATGALHDGYWGNDRITRRLLSKNLRCHDATAIGLFGDQLRF
jgi:hypothetical protein